MLKFISFSFIVGVSNFATFLFMKNEMLEKSEAFKSDIAVANAEIAEYEHLTKDLANTVTILSRKIEENTVNEELYSVLLSRKKFDNSSYKHGRPISDKKYIGMLEDAIYSIWDIQHEIIIDYATNKYGKMFDIDPDLLKAQLKAESGYDPLAISYSKDIGIAQLNSYYLDYFEKRYKDTFDKLEAEAPKFNPFNPISAIATQGMILNDIRITLNKRYNIENADISIKDLIASYNMGVNRYMRGGRRLNVNNITPRYYSNIMRYLAMD